MTREEKKAYDKAYREKNKEKLEKQRREWFEKNKSKKYAQNKLWRENNPEKVKEITKKSNTKFKDLNKGYSNQYNKKRKKDDACFHFIYNLRIRQGKVLKGFVSTTAGLGCTTQELVKYLSSQFTQGMTLENHGWGEGCWHMDHKIPLETHEKDAKGDWDANSEYNKKLIHYTNLQPMWHKPNLQKGAKVDEKDLQEFLERVI